MPKIPKIVLLVDTSESFGRQFLRGIVDYTKTIRPWHLYRNPPFYKQYFSQAHKLEWLKNTAADGLISPFAVDPDLQDYIRHIPCVISSKNIQADHKQIAEMAARYLIETGLTQFAFCGYNEIDWSQSREQYFKAFLADNGFKVFCYNPKAQTESYAQEHEYLTTWLCHLPKPIGIMACNDDCGMDVLSVCAEKKIRVPEDIAVMGVDDDEVVCETSNPPLTSIAYNAQRAGFEAASILDKMLLHRRVANPAVIIKPTTIVRRQSTDILYIPDRDVADALAYIRDNIRKPIQVEDVVSQADCSRKTLSNKFRAVLGRSIIEEITRFKVEEIARMLVSTKLPVSQIARMVNASGIEHISRYFQKIKGLTPTEYREKYGMITSNGAQ